MDTLNGSLSQISLPELLRQCANQQKSGTLALNQAGVYKRLYFDAGKLIYITSNKSGERVGEFLVQRGDLTRSWAGFLLKDSQRNGIGFTSSLLKKNIFDPKRLKKALSELATTILADAMSWTRGTFEFNETLPPQVLEGPVQISEEDALAKVLAMGTSHVTSDEEILRDLARKISQHSLNLPLLPVRSRKLSSLALEGGQPDEIFRMVRNDQILTGFLLRVLNSGTAITAQKCETLRQAAELYSPDHLLGIIHAKAATALQPSQPETACQLLQHALRCACLSEQIAAQLGEDDQLAYTCGLLHNIGKILLLELLSDDQTAKDKRLQLIQKFHQNAGALLARRWNLAPEIHTVIKHYQNPLEAKEFQSMAEIAYLSHSLLRDTSKIETYRKNCPTIRFGQLDIEALKNNLPLIDEIVAGCFGC
ncbi:MAG: HDOD domain-containing protein [Desulfuromonadaceae bacterium]|nr:HDOD domain-containing protein [Desulfuromonadaceae bacterium]